MQETSYELNTFELNQFKFIKKLTPDEFNLIDDNILTLSEYFDHFLVFLYFSLNYYEFLKVDKNFTAVQSSTLDLKRIHHLNFGININRIIFNLLCSFKFFIENTDVYLKRKYHKDSKEVNDFQQLIRSIYDSSFAYRFLDKLRNYSQHIAFPIYIVSYSVNNGIENPEKMTGDFKLLVSREKLLAEKKLLSVKVLKDISEMNEDINILPLVKELNQRLFEIEKFVFLLQDQAISKAIALLESVGLKYKTEKNEVTIIYNGRMEDNHFYFENLPLPFDKIKEIKNLMNWC